MTRRGRVAMIGGMRPASYRITVRGRLTERFSAAFDGMEVEPREGETVLVGVLRDQAQLYGLLNRLRDFGIELVSVEEAPAP
jgi:hypothetical protein